MTRAFLGSTFGALVALALAAASTTSEGHEGHAHRVVREGIVLEAVLEPARPDRVAVVEGEDARVRITLTDEKTGAPLTGLRPAAWLDGRTASGEDACRRKVGPYLQGSLRARPEVDLNAYYILALNREGSISVIDPLLGYGTSKLLALVMLPSPGEDWALSRDGRKLFVSMPAADKIGVVDTTTWKLARTIPAGPRPGRVALQPDGEYLWVGTEVGPESGVTVIRTADLSVAARIATGAGRHELAFSPDDRFALVTNEEAGTLTVIDVRRLARVRDVSVGSRPAGLAVSALSKTAYVASAGEGVVRAIDLARQEVVATMRAEAGLVGVQIEPGGRWGFALNPEAHRLHIFDTTTNRLVRGVELGARPDQLAFTTTSVVVRSAESEQVTVIPLKDLDRPGDLPAVRFPGGQQAPGAVGRPGGARVMVPAPEPNAVLVANPADQTIYYYMEGMAAPMGSFQNYRRTPQAVLVVNRSLRETAPGTYATTARMPRSGAFSLAVLVDSPRLVECFEVAVERDARRGRGAGKLSIRAETADRRAPVGEPFAVRFSVREAASGALQPGIPDVAILAVRSSGGWHQLTRARASQDGLYEAEFTFPSRGAYFLYFEIPSRRLPRNHIRPLVFSAQPRSVRPAGVQP